MGPNTDSSHDSSRARPIAVAAVSHMCPAVAGVYPQVAAPPAGSGTSGDAVVEAKAVPATMKLDSGSAAKLRELGLEFGGVSNVGLRVD